MSAPHLHHSDKKLGRGANVYNEFKELSVVLSFTKLPKFLKFTMSLLQTLVRDCPGEERVESICHGTQCFGEGVDDA